MAGHKKKAKGLRYGSWKQVTAKKIFQGAGTQTFQAYVGRIQATVAEWVYLRPIFGVCARDTSYDGGGRLQVPRWRQAAAEKQLKVAVEAISEAARVRRRQEFGRRDGSKVGSEGGRMDTKG